MISYGLYDSQYIKRVRGLIDISVFIPVYNGELSLSELICRINNVFSRLDYRFEFVLVDDGSTDDSWQVIKSLHEENGNLCAIRHQKNMGYNFSLQHGLELCTGKWVLTLDDDLQHLPEEIPKLLKMMEEEDDVDVIFGYSIHRKHSLWRNIGSKLYFGLFRFLSGLPQGTHITSFRLISRQVVDHIVHQKFAEPQAGFMILNATRNIENVVVQHGERKYGKSGMKLSKMLRLTLDLVLHHTTIPLKVISATGAGAFVISLLLSLFYLINYVFSQSVLSGFTTIVLLILAFGGLSLLGIGIVGFYVSRLLRQATYTPVYPIRDYLPVKIRD